ncbi:MAG TPA: ABC-2 family transporter protein [Anaerolineae bacterium]
MGVFLAIAAKSFQRSMAYRAANLAGIVTNTFFGAVYIFGYIALFRSRSQLGGLDLQNTITYAVLSQSLLMAMTAFGNLDLSEAIVKGDIASDLARPVDFYLLWAATDLGRAAYFFLFRGLPTFLLGWLLFHPSLPAAPAAGLLFLPAVALGMAVSFAFRFITGSLAFWLTDARGVNSLSTSLVIFLSGFAVPLNFFPGALRTIAEWLPFNALANLPINLYLGKLPPAALAATLAREAGWLVVLVALGRWLLARLMGRLSVNGG